MVAYAVAAAMASSQALNPLGCRDGNIESNRELAKLGTKMSASRCPEATSSGLCGEEGQTFLFLASGHPRQAAQ